MGLILRAIRNRLRILLDTTWAAIRSCTWWFSGLQGRGLAMLAATTGRDFCFGHFHGADFSAYHVALLAMIGRLAQG